MSDFDYFKQYQSENKRIQDKIQAEENPIHREHLVFIDEMIDEKIRSQFPALFQQYSETQRVNVETYLNGKPADGGDIVKGVKEMVLNAIKHMGKRR